MKRFKSATRSTGLAAMLAASTALVTPALADEQTDDSAQSNSWLDAENFLVTARKKEETLQEVPLAITAFNANEIESRSIETLQDVAAATPGLVYAEASNGTFGVATIRGLTQINVTAPDRNVAIFYGGLFQFNPAASNLELVDLERVEVVKGPQSTLYGRNAFAGAINYVPAKAVQDFDANVSLTAGSDERFGLQGMVNLPISDTFAVRLSGGYDEFDGTWTNNQNFGDNLGGYESVAFAWDARFTPNDSVEVGFFGFYADRNADVTAQFVLPNTCGFDELGGSTELLFLCGEVPVITDTGADPRAFGNQSENLILGFEWDYEVGNFTISSLTGYVASDSVYLNDFEKNRGFVQTVLLDPTMLSNPITGGFAGFGEIKSFLELGGNTEDIMTELRLGFDNDGPFTWSIGASYYTHRDEEQAGIVCDGSRIPAGLISVDLCGSVFPLALVGANEISLDNVFRFQDDVLTDETWGFFGAVEYAVTDAFTVGAELRYDTEDRSRFQAADEAGTKRSATFDFISYRVTGSYQVSNDVLLFGSVARGTISGNFNNDFDAAAILPVPEELQTYNPQNNLTFELGMNSMWLDGTLLWNTTLFYSQYKDLVVAATPPAPLIASLSQNVGNATSYGFETQISWEFTPGWRVDTSYGYSDPTFDDGTLDLGLARFTGSGEGAIFTTDVSGNSLSRTSNHTVSGSLSHFGDLSDVWSYFLRADVNYQSKQFTRSVPDQSIAGRTLVNLRATLTYSDNWEIAVWGRNVLDEKYNTIITGDAPVTFGAFEAVGNLGQRRTFGATATWRY